MLLFVRPEDQDSGSRGARQSDHRAVQVRNVRRPHRAVSAGRPMTIRYPYKGDGARRVRRVSHSHSAEQLVALVSRDAADPPHRGGDRAALSPGSDEDADPPGDRPGSGGRRLLRGASATPISSTRAIARTAPISPRAATSGDAVRDALPHQRLRRLARRLDAPDRQVGRHGRHVGHRRRRRAHRHRRGARGADEGRRSRRRGVPRRRDDRRRRDGREPQLRGAEEAAGRSSSARTTSIRCSRRSRRASRRATSARGPRRTGCRRWRWTASTCSPCTMRSRPRSRARERATARRSSKSPVYRFRAHGGAGDDSQTGYRAEAERIAWEAVDPLPLFGEYLTRSAQLDASRHSEDGRRDRRGDCRGVRVRAREPESNRRGSLPPRLRRYNHALG